MAPRTKPKKGPTRHVGGLGQMACASHDDPCTLSFIGDYFGLAVSAGNVCVLSVSTHYPSGVVASGGGPVHYQQQVLLTLSRTALGVPCAMRRFRRQPAAVPVVSCAGVWARPRSRGMSSTAASIATASIVVPRKTWCTAVVSASGATRSLCTPDRPRVAFTTAPNTATPTALPVERKNMLEPVTTPRCCH